jgi:hypothetical protein
MMMMITWCDERRISDASSELHVVVPTEGDGESRGEERKTKAKGEKKTENGKQKGTLKPSMMLCR